MKQNLKFQEAKKDSDIKDIVGYDQRAFSSIVGFEWSLEGLEAEKKSSWKVFGIYNNNHILASALVKKAGGVLLTKTTPVKLDFQGNGFSHQIKDYLEDYAIKNKCNTIQHFCRHDDFRGISLNETHGYFKLDKKKVMMKTSPFGKKS